MQRFFRNMQQTGTDTFAKYTCVRPVIRKKGIIFMKQVKLKYLLSYILREIIIRHEQTKVFSNLTAGV